VQGYRALRRLCYELRMNPDGIQGISQQFEQLYRELFPKEDINVLRVDSINGKIDLTQTDQIRLLQKMKSVMGRIKLNLDDVALVLEEKKDKILQEIDTCITSLAHYSKSMLGMIGFLSDPSKLDEFEVKLMERIERLVGNTHEIYLKVSAIFTKSKDFVKVLGNLRELEAYVQDNINWFNFDDSIPREQGLTFANGQDKQEGNIIREFITVEIPDDLSWYLPIVKMINKSYGDEDFQHVTPFLARLLFENILYDILEIGLKPEHKELYLDTSKRQRRDFAQLIILFKEINNSNEFPAAFNFSEKSFEWLDKIRQYGNFTAHGILDHFQEFLQEITPDRVDELLGNLISLYQKILKSNNRSIDISPEKLEKIKEKLNIKRIGGKKSIKDAKVSQVKSAIRETGLPSDALIKDENMLKSTIRELVALFNEYKEKKDDLKTERSIVKKIGVFVTLNLVSLDLIGFQKLGPDNFELDTFQLHFTRKGESITPFLFLVRKMQNGQMKQPDEVYFSEGYPESQRKLGNDTVLDNFIAYLDSLAR